jgi:hypothetical protein
MPRGVSKKLAWQSPSPKSNAAYKKSFKKIKKIPDEYWIGGSFKKRINLFWEKQKKERKKWKEIYGG